jgi:hypothetical protein
LAGHVDAFKLRLDLGDASTRSGDARASVKKGRLTRVMNASTVVLCVLFGIALAEVVREPADRSGPAVAPVAVAGR